MRELAWMWMWMWMHEAQSERAYHDGCVCSRKREAWEIVSGSKKVKTSRVARIRSSVSDAATNGWWSMYMSVSLQAARNAPAPERHSSLRPSSPPSSEHYPSPHSSPSSTAPINYPSTSTIMASAAINPEHLRLARSLPSQLLNFFKKYPPGAFQSASAISTSTQPQDPASPSIPEATSPADTKPNPFLPLKNPLTNRWQPPAYSLRRQAALVKLAQAHDVLSLLPWSSKSPAEVERKRAEHGLRVKGTGVGQKVKGKMWERTLKGRLDERRKAMEAMPEMIREWKQRGHGRGYKKFARK